MDVQNVVEFDGVEVEIIDDAQITQELVVELRSSSSSTNLNEQVEEPVVPADPEDPASSLNLEPPTIIVSSLASPTFSETVYPQQEDATVEPQQEAGESLQPQGANPQFEQGQEELGSAGESNESFLHPGSPNPDIFSFDSQFKIAATGLPFPSDLPSSQLPDIDQAFPLPRDVLMHIGDSVSGSFHLEGQPNHRVEPLPAAPANAFSADKYIQNFITSMNQNQQQITFPSSFPHSSEQARMGFQTPVNPRINQRPTTSFPNCQNNSYNNWGFSPFRPQTNQHAGATSRFDPQSSNFMLPRSFAPIRPQTNQQFGATPKSDPRIGSNFMPSKPYVPIRPQFQRANPVNRTPNGINMQFSYPVQPAMPSQFMTDGWMNPSFNQLLMTHNTNFPNRPNPSYLAPGSSLPSRVLNSLEMTPENAGFDYQVGTTSTSNNQQVMFGQQGNAPRRSFGIGESSSSPFKRFRRDPVVEEASNQNEQMTYQPDLFNSADFNIPQPLWNTTGYIFSTDHMKNSLYDPRFEGIGLPIDPHLRGMDFNFATQGRYV